MKQEHTIIHIPFLGTSDEKIKKALASAAQLVPDGKSFKYSPPEFIKSKYGDFWTLPAIIVER